MSALFAITGKEVAALSHDTFCHRPWEPGQTELEPFNYATKSVLLPQFKSIIGAVGSNTLLSEVFKLIQTRVIGRDVHSVLNLNLPFLKENLPATNCTGTITLCGFSEREERFKVYGIRINSDTDEDWFDNDVMVLPSFISATTQISKLTDPLDEIAGQAIHIIKECDDRSPVKERVGVGGQVIVNILYLDKYRNIRYNSFVHHTYPDFEEMGGKMMIHL